MIYLDNCATTMPDKTVLKSFNDVSTNYFANPSSIHSLGGNVEQLYSKARAQTAALLGVNEDEIIFTSGGTEGNNIAIKGIAHQHKLRGNHIITTEIEHPSVYEAFQSLEEDGFDVTYLQVDGDGIVSVEELKKSIRDETTLISVMHVNNETGAIQPIEEIAEIASQHPKLFFHVDAVQALGKVSLNLSEHAIDLCTYSGHKIHGLKGTGLLYVKKGTTLSPLFNGGGQEFKLRSGTENVAGNVAFTRALRLILERQSKDLSHIKYLKNKMLSHLEKNEHIYINTPEKSAAHIINVSVPHIKPETIINELSEKGIYISTQSACSSKQLEKSRVLLASGHSDERATSGLRISLSYDTKEEEVDVFLQEFEEIVTQLKRVLE